MRLINTTTLELEEFLGTPPPYVILSHTWDVEEVSFAEFRDPTLRARLRGFTKVTAACQRALADNYRYLWVDTCCIDKSSSAELSEAINCMFNWYKQSKICYAYLADVEAGTAADFGRHDSAVARSRWFRRGWTLQELVAPKRVEFFTRLWQRLGEKTKLVNDLSSITGIDRVVLLGVASVQSICVGMRMSWAAGRQTTRPEDVAYSLLGIFDVNMPLLYGEGDKAFLRLQEEIVRRYNDETIFAWRRDGGTPKPSKADGEDEEDVELCGFFATSPEDFTCFRWGDYFTFRGLEIPRTLSVFSAVSDPEAPESHFLVSNNGITATAFFADLNTKLPGQSMILVLNCCGDDHHSNIGVHVERRVGKRYARARPDKLVSFYKPYNTTQMQTVYLARTADELQYNLFSEPWLRSPIQIIKNVSASALRSIATDFDYGFYLPQLAPGGKEGFQVRFITALGSNQCVRIREGDDADMLLKPPILGYRIIAVSPAPETLFIKVRKPWADLKLNDFVPQVNVELYSTSTRVCDFVGEWPEKDQRWDIASKEIVLKAPEATRRQETVVLRTQRMGPIKVWVLELNGPMKSTATLVEMIRGRGRNLQQTV